MPCFLPPASSLSPAKHGNAVQPQRVWVWRGGKPSKGSRRPVWMSRELLEERRWNRTVHGMWKEDRPLGRNTGTLSEHEGMQRGSLRPTWN